jgi:hypothetical protein
MYISCKYWLNILTFFFPHKRRHFGRSEGTKTLRRVGREESQNVTIVTPSKVSADSTCSYKWGFGVSLALVTAPSTIGRKCRTWRCCKQPNYYT